MISLGVVDVILLLLLLLAIYLALKRRGLGLSILVAVILVVVLFERLAPGSLARIGDDIRGVDQINNAGPHLTIQPIVHLER